MVFSNAAPGGVYYVGIKSEDQQSADYAFLGVFSLFPPSTSDTNGNVFTHAWPVRPGFLKETRPGQARRCVNTLPFVSLVLGGRD